MKTEEIALSRLVENKENPRTITTEKNGHVSWNEVRHDIEELHQYDWGRAQGYNCNSREKRAKFMGMTMAEYMRYLWNNPQNGQSPYKLFEGAMVPDGKDVNGNIIYRYNGAKF